METQPLKPMSGAPVPLFDRLADSQPNASWEQVPLRILDRDGLIASITREAHRLVNTRAPEPMSQWPHTPRTVMNYGIPDFTHLSPQNGSHVAQLAELIAHAIECYEPRLREVKLSPAQDQTPHESFSYHVQALLVVGSVTEPISFPLAPGPTPF